MASYGPYGPWPRMAAGAAVVLAVTGLLAACGVVGKQHAGQLSATGWNAQRFKQADAQIRRSMGTSHTAKPTPSTARIGALFNHDKNGDHFCSGSVVQSPGKDLVVTAAHCIHGGRGAGYKNDIVFVPSYRNGAAPKGEWQVRSLVVDQRWADSSDPDADVGFVVLRPRGGKHIEDVLGANRLGTGIGSDAMVRLTGYPSSRNDPISCFNRTTRQSDHQLRIDCTGFTGGTSGSPWLTAFDPITRTGTVVGVIGGYQAGGATDDTSYSPYFDEDVRALYLKAVSQDAS